MHDGPMRKLDSSIEKPLGCSLFKKRPSQVSGFEERASKYLDIRMHTNTHTQKCGMNLGCLKYGRKEALPIRRIMEKVAESGRLWLDGSRRGPSKGCLILSQHGGRPLRVRVLAGTSCNLTAASSLPVPLFFGQLPRNGGRWVVSV